MTHSESISHDLKLRVLWVVIGWCLVSVVIFLSLTAQSVQMPSFNQSDKLGHLLAYATLMGWFGQLYLRHKTQVIYAAGFVVLGVSMEILQGMGGVRFFEYFDMLANSLGVVIGWILTRGWCSGWLKKLDAQLSLKAG